MTINLSNNSKEWLKHYTLLKIIQEYNPKEFSYLSSLWAEQHPNSLPLMTVLEDIMKKNVEKDLTQD